LPQSAANELSAVQPSQRAVDEAEAPIHRVHQLIGKVRDSGLEILSAAAGVHFRNPEQEFVCDEYARSEQAEDRNPYHHKASPVKHGQQ
jgi:hypothetical protein